MIAQGSMNIGGAAVASGVSAKMIRYYESVALIPSAHRTASGYRQYDEGALRRLRFLKRARGLGFSVEQMRDLLALWQDEGRSKSEVTELALSHAAALEEKAREIGEIAAALRALAVRCAASRTPGCPIIEALAETAPSDGSGPQPVDDQIVVDPPHLVVGR